MNTLDAALLRKWSRDSDAEAFNELVRRHADMVYGTCRRILRNGADAEDVTQECFVHLAQAGAGIRSSVAGWLHVLATHRSLGLIKREARRRAREERFAEQVQAAEAAGWSEIEVLVDEAIAELPEPLRDVVVAHFLERRTHEAIAEESGIPRRTVTHRISRGVERMRRSLREKGVRVESSALAGLLGAAEVEATPAHVAASLGKVALAGVRPATVAVTTAAGHSLALGLKSLVAAGVALAASAVIYLVVQTSGVARDDGNTLAVAAESPGPAQPAPPPEPENRDSVSPPAAPAEEDPEPPAPDPDAIADPGQFIAVSGTVKDENGQPVPSAKVLLALAMRPSRVYETNTDFAGRYAFAQVKHVGRAMFVAAKRGYVSDFKGEELRPGQTYTGQDISLRPGITFEGTVIAPDGLVVTDGVVSSGEAWNAHDYAPSSRVAFVAALTDESGHFEMGFDEKAEWACIGVNSDTRGSDFFPRVSVLGGAVRLEMKEKARLHGKVTWSDGRPAEGKVVVVLGRLPEPDTNTIRTDLPIPDERRSIVAADGSYSVGDLCIAMTYEVLVIENEPGKHASVSTPLMAPLRGLTFSPGENAEKNFTVSLGGHVVGRVLTEKTRRPVADTRVYIAGENQTGFPESRPTDADGGFEFKKTPGTYTLYTRGFTDDYDEIIKKKFGRKIPLGAGETVTQDLEIFEPIEIRVRIVDPEGKPVKQATVGIDVVSPNGRRSGGNGSAEIDPDRWVTFHVYQPVAEVWASAGRSFQGPVVETPHFSPEPGEVLPVETLVLEATCTVAGVVVDADGKAVSDRSARITALYDDGTENRIDVGLGLAGQFSALPGTAELRAGTATFVVTADGVEGEWRSGPIECLPDQVVDLGQIVIGPKQEPAEQPDKTGDDEE